MKRTCGYCIFAEEADSTDILWCWKVKKRKDVTDPGCPAFQVNPMLRQASGDVAIFEEKEW